MIGKHICTIGSACVLAAAALASASAAENLVLSRDGFFYVGGKPTVIDGREYITGQMYVEVRIPAAKTKPYPIVMVHGGTMSGTNYTGTPDGREGWAVFRAPGLRGLCGRPARPRPLRLPRRRIRAEPQCPAQQFGVALRLPGEIEAVAAGASSQPVAGHRRARR